jgi:hypothetical protein
MDGRSEFLDGHALKQVCLCTCLECAKYVFVAVEGCEYDEAGGGVFSAYAADGLDAGDIGELQIHQCNVGLQRSMERNGRSAISSLANDVDFGHDPEQGDEALSNDMMVIDHEDSDSLRHSIMRLSFH